MSDEIHFEVKDYAGRTIICTEIQWEDHVLSPRHKYMEGAEREVIETLQSPKDGIRYIDRVYPNRRVYYKDCFDYVIKVVVEYENENCEGTGYLFTTYMPDHVTRGEKPEV